MDPEIEATLFILLIICKNFRSNKVIKATFTYTTIIKIKHETNVIKSEYGKKGLDPAPTLVYIARKSEINSLVVVAGS